MKRGMTKADAKVTKVTGGKLAKTLLRIVGLGLAAGVALIAATDKTMKKVFPQDEQEVAGEGWDVREAGKAEEDGADEEADPAGGGVAKDEHVSRDFVHWEDEKND